MNNQQITDLVKFIAAVVGSVGGAVISLRAAIKRGAAKEIEANRILTEAQAEFNRKQSGLVDDALDFAHRADERSKGTEEILRLERVEWDRMRGVYTDQINALTAEVRRLNRLVESFREQLAKLTEDV